MRENCYFRASSLKAAITIMFIDHIFL